MCFTGNASHPVLWSNARGLLRDRIGATSIDGGMTWSNTSAIPGLTQPLQGCEGSTILQPETDLLFFSGPASTSIERFNLSLWTLPAADGPNGHWKYVGVVFAGAAAYSSLTLLPPVASLPAVRDIGILFDRANKTSIVFDPDYISFARLQVAARP